MADFLNLGIEVNISRQWIPNTNKSFGEETALF